MITNSILALQPIVCGDTQSHKAYEALARFPKPDGLKGPYEALRKGEWAALDLEMLENLRNWLRYGNQRRTPLFINISAETLCCEDNFEAWIEGFRDFQAEARAPVMLEVSEFVGDDVLDRRWSDLSAISQGVVLDDFGDCFSSLDRLKGYPWALCKFECASLNGPDSQQAISYCQSHGIKQVVERIETPCDVARARARNVDLHQGYFYGRPLPVAVDYSVRKVELV